MRSAQWIDRARLRKLGPGESIAGSRFPHFGLRGCHISMLVVGEGFGAPLLPKGGKHAVFS